MEAMWKDLADMTIPVLCIVGLFTFLAVASVADARRRERVERYRSEVRKALIDKWGGNDPEQLLQLLRNESKPNGTSLIEVLRDEKPIDPKRRRERILMTGMITTAIGAGFCIALYLAGSDNDWAVGLIPLLVGLAILIHAIAFARS